MTQSLATQLLDHIGSNSDRFVMDLRNIVGSILSKWGRHDLDTVNDIVQDCFIRITESLQDDKFRGKSSFKTYVYAIARYACIDHFRWQRHVGHTDIDQLVLADPSGTGEDLIIAREERSVAYRVLMALPKECRRLWRTVFYGKKNYRETAEALGMMEGTVKRKMWECRSRARELAERYSN